MAEEVSVDEPGAEVYEQFTPVGAPGPTDWGSMVEEVPSGVDPLAVSVDSQLTLRDSPRLSCLALRGSRRSY